MIDLTSNRISAALSTEAFAAVKTELQNVSRHLSFLVKLSQEEVEAMYKMSEADKSFVRNCLTEMGAAADILPPYLKTDDISTDLACTDQLLELENSLSEMLINVRRNRILAGKEAYNGAAVFYRLVSAAARSGSGPAKAMHERLQKYHQNKTKGGKAAAARRAERKNKTALD